MSPALAYVSTRAFMLFVGFLRHWYVDGFIYVVHQGLSILEQLDQTLALKITLRHMFEPLYQDYSIVGRVLGIIFRTFRVIIGGAIYAVISTITIAIYLIWALIPLFLLFKATQ